VDRFADAAQFMIEPHVDHPGQRAPVRTAATIADAGRAACRRSFDQPPAGSGSPATGCLSWIPYHPGFKFRLGLHLDFFQAGTLPAGSPAARTVRQTHH